MKKLFFILSIFCHEMTAMPCNTFYKDTYNMESYKVDSISISIVNTHIGYKLAFEINKEEMKCHIENMLTGKTKISNIQLADSSDIYSGIKNFLINGNQKNDYMEERPIPYNKTPISQQEDYVFWINILIYINGRFFVNNLYLGDIYSGEKQDVVDWTVVYSKPFRRFMQKMEKHIIKELGEGTVTKYKSMINKIKKKHPDDILF